MFAVVGFGGGAGHRREVPPGAVVLARLRGGRSGLYRAVHQGTAQAAPADTIGELTKNDGMKIRDQAYEYYQAERYWN